jgi:hypothetical protein
MRIWKCDVCDTVMDETPPVTVNVLVQLEDDDDDDDDECDEYEITENQFCSLGCLATWAMREVLENTGVEL